MFLNTTKLADWYLSQAHSALATRDYHTTKVKTEAAIKLDPSFKTYNTLGICFGMADDLENAIARFTKSIKMNPDHTEAKVNRITILEKMEKRKRLHELEKGHISVIGKELKDVFNNLYKEDRTNV